MIADRTVADFHASLRQGDRRVCYHIAAGLRRNGISSFVLYEQLLIPALIAAGEFWHANESSVLEEHLSTAIVRDIVSWDTVASHPPEPRLGTVMLGCVPEERHDMGAMMLGNLLEAEGWSVRFYGGAVPAEDILSGIDLYRPNLLYLSMKLPARLDDTVDLLHQLREAYPRLGLVIGGIAVPSIRAVMAPLVHGFADTLGHGLELARTWKNSQDSLTSME